MSWLHASISGASFSRPPSLVEDAGECGEEEDRGVQAPAHDAEPVGQHRARRRAAPEARAAQAAVERVGRRERPDRVHPPAGLREEQERARALVAEVEQVPRPGCAVEPIPVTNSNSR